MEDVLDDKELLLLIALYLKDGPCTEAAKALVEELSEKQLFPKRTDWQGRDCTDSNLQEIAACLNVNGNTLPDVLHKAILLAKNAEILNFRGLKTIVGSCLSSYPDRYDYFRSSFEVIVKKVSLRSKKQGNSYFLLQSNQLSNNNVGLLRTLHPCHWDDFKLLRPILGHLAPIYCLSYDVTGQYVITGADDCLVKIWSHVDGRLLATLRGHQGETSDIALSQDNTLIASASNDKTIRIWCSQSCIPVTTLVGHSGIVTSVQFIPSTRTDCRFVASTSTDGYTMFWKYNPETMEFDESPIKFMEKNRIGDRILCSAVSPGGTFFVTGCSSTIRVYDTSQSSPILMAELTEHTDQISVLQCGKTGRVCFASGARDGTAKVWHFTNGRWKDITLPACHLGTSSLAAENMSSKWKKQITMVSFDCTDTFVITASSPDCIVRVWHASTGDILQDFKYHTNEVYVLEGHPVDPSILVSGGHDGHIVVWDILSGRKLKVFNFEFEDEGQACIYDVKFSPSGDRFVAIDSQGHLLLFGMGNSYPYEKFPKEQFFHTDYRPFVVDRQHNVVDEQAQVPPHLMPPPVLVNIDGDTHPLKDQVGILELITRPGSHKDGEILGASTEGGVDNSTDNHTLGIIWTNHLSEADYMEAVKLWQNRVVIPPLDTDLLQSVMERFECMHKMESVTLSSEIPICSEATNDPPSVHVEESILAPLRPLSESDNESVSTSREEEVDIELSSIEEHSSLCSSGESDESDWTMDYDFAENITKSKATNRQESNNFQVDYSEEPGANPSSYSVSPDGDHDGLSSLWLSQTKPLAQPYCPQIGDAVVYFPQGHQLYIEAVRNDKVYSLRGFKAPWHIYDMKDHELCIVTGIQYHVGPPITCSVTLVPCSQDNDGTCMEKMRFSPSSFTIKYHDMDSVLDFIILRDSFTRAISMEWSENMKFCSFIDGSWWNGTVLERKPFSEDHPNSYWLCYSIQWDDRNIECISPWDMNQIPIEGDEHQLKQEPLLVLNDSNSLDEQTTQRIMEGLEWCIENMEESRAFIDPVDLNMYPDYCLVVPLPMNLSTIKARLQSSFYRRTAAVLWDLILLFHNVVLYNEDESEIVKLAAVVVNSLFKFIRNASFPSISVCYNEVCEVNRLTLVTTAKLWAADPVCFVFQETSPIISTNEVKYDRFWRTSCIQLLDELMLSDFAAPFVHPVDTIEYPDYGSVVRQPMDLSEIRQKLSSSQYSTPVGFVDDLKLIVKNSELYNTDIHSLIYHMTIQLNDWINKQLSKFLGGSPPPSEENATCSKTLEPDLDDLPAVIDSKESTFWPISPPPEHENGSDECESPSLVGKFCEQDWNLHKLRYDVEPSNNYTKDDQPISTRLRKRQFTSDQVILQNKRSRDSQTEEIDDCPSFYTRCGRQVRPTSRYHDS